MNTIITRNGSNQRNPGRRTPRLAVLAVVALFGALGGWIAAPGGAAAESRCQSYCAGPHKDYNDCMEKCINSQQNYSPRRADHSIAELCRSKGHDEESCLRDHGYSGHDQRGNCFRDRDGRVFCERD